MESQLVWIVKKSLLVLDLSFAAVNVIVVCLCSIVSLASKVISGSINYTISFLSSLKIDKILNYLGI